MILAKYRTVGIEHVFLSEGSIEEMKAMQISIIVCTLLIGSASFVQSREGDGAGIFTMGQVGIHLGLTAPPLIGLAVTNVESGRAWPFYGLFGGILMAVGDSYAIYAYNKEYEVDEMEKGDNWKETTDGLIAFSSVMLAVDVAQIGWSIYRLVKYDEKASIPVVENLKISPIPQGVMIGYAFKF